VKGIVTDIQRFSVHDGPGIRTTVFLKGCNMRCRWCHNPEALRANRELQFIPLRCIGCGACLKACLRGAQAAFDGRRVFHRDRCAACGACAAACHAEALTLVGRQMSAEEVLDEVLLDRAYYRNSGGGVTLSGGEPLFQRDFSRQVLTLCKEQGLHTAIQTNLAWPWEHVAEVLDVVDLVMIDIKTTDRAAHLEWTGLPNDRVLDNAARLGRSPPGSPGGRTTVRLVVRTPVVRGVNDTPAEIGRIADFIAAFGNLLYYELLAYHPLGQGKYESLGLDCPAGLDRPGPEQMRALAAEARKRGIPVRTADDR
jgi:pyruvate formate lyase activating enzyme